MKIAIEIKMKKTVIEVTIGIKLIGIFLGCS